MARKQYLADEDLDRMYGRWQFLIEQVSPALALQRVELALQERNKPNPLATPKTVANILNLEVQDVNRMIKTWPMYGKYMRGKWHFPIRAFAVLLYDVLVIHLEWKNREELRAIAKNKPKKRTKTK